jgi:hypothetical protein
MPNVKLSRIKGKKKKKVRMKKRREAYTKDKKGFFLTINN